jgi:2-haloacid dehalogenase
VIDPTKIDVVTFDCYGTLIDWESGIVGALGPVLEAHARKLDHRILLATYAELEAAAEKGPYRPYARVLAEVVRGFGRKLGFEPTPGDERCLERSLPGWRPFPDTVPALRELARRFDLAVISNVDDDLFAHTRRALGPGIGRVVTAAQARAYKPDPRVFEHALHEIGVPAGRVLHAAQSIYHDVNPAHALGMATAWIRRRGDAGATLPAAGQADVVVPDLAALASALL